MFNQGQLPFDKMITHQFNLEKINDAFEVLKQGHAGRIIIKMKDA
jgi:Zn-dependent alcohol dehydrogenase